MGMDKKHIEELISQRYIQLLSNRAGHVATRPESDYGVDLCIQEIGERKSGKSIRYYPTTRKIDLQLKASINLSEKNGIIKYRLEKKNYLDCIARGKSLTPLIFIIFQLPKNENDWLTVSENELLVRKCAYYYIPTGNEKKCVKTVLLEIPATNVVTIDFFDKVFQGIIK